MNKNWKILCQQGIELLFVFGLIAFLPAFNTVIPDFAPNTAIGTAMAEAASWDLNDDLEDFFDGNEEHPSNSSDNAGSAGQQASEQSAEETEEEDDFFSDEASPTPYEPEQSNPDQSELPEKLSETYKPLEFISGVRLSGDLWLESGYRFNHDPPAAGQSDHRSLSDLSAGLRLELTAKPFNSWKFFISGSGEHDFAYELNDTAYFQVFLDDNEQEIELEKAYLQGSLTERLDLKLGRQIVVWGKSDNIRVTDILNPLDIREPGKTDIEDLRLPVLMSNIGYYVSNLNLSIYLIHEHRSHKRPVFGSPYYFFKTEMPDSDSPDNSPENTELAGSMNISFHGMDISVYLASFFDDMPYLSADGSLRHERLHMAGAALNRAAGNFLFKAETAMFDGIRLSALQTGAGLMDNPKDYKRLDGLLGFEYSGFKNTNVSFEFADRWLINHDQNAEAGNNDEQTYQYALRWTRTFLNQIMEVSFLASLYGKEADDGGFIRIQSDYDLSDNLELSVGEITYKSGSPSFLKSIGANDMFFGKLTYSF